MEEPKKISQYHFALLMQSPRRRFLSLRRTFPAIPPQPTSGDPSSEEVVGDVGSLIKSRFRRKKVLMILDDVDHADQLKELAGSNAWFGKGSRIIITTRDNHLLEARKVNVIYSISLLNDDD
ncbi:hypothetical protein OSB04_018697 [Centaurea solstitialis]|uniref:NB-ARC domain-containing protein n=1 Tax=Centaurea solstitialis TaxID=347529 RepID=A0AA38TNE3_9ASTR|nr:hypothetical protein OSB04_018697 [Centaurea solstitialis]